MKLIRFLFVIAILVVLLGECSSNQSDHTLGSKRKDLSAAKESTTNWREDVKQELQSLESHYDQIFEIRRYITIIQQNIHFYEKRQKAFESTKNDYGGNFWVYYDRETEKPMKIEMRGYSSEWGIQEDYFLKDGKLIYVFEDRAFQEPLDKPTTRIVQRRVCINNGRMISKLEKDHVFPYQSGIDIGGVENKETIDESIPADSYLNNVDAFLVLIDSTKTYDQICQELFE